MGNNSRGSAPNEPEQEMGVPQWEAQEAKQEELPGGWESYIDEKSGRPYYFNVDTREVTWSNPCEADGMIEREEELPDGWESQIDEASGQPYFWHRDTREVTWISPNQSDANRERSSP